jgi:hypothetical protein
VGSGSIAVENCTTDGVTPCTLAGASCAGSSDCNDEASSCSKVGSYIVRLAIEDNEGLVARDSVVVVVHGQDQWPPVARIVARMPTGMHVDERTGDLTWTPTASQVGRHRVTLKATNDAGIDIQDCVIDVAPAADTTDGLNSASRGVGCSCKSNPDPSLWIVLCAVLLWRRRSRHVARLDV